WRADAELGRTATAGGDGLDHQIDVDAGLQAQRHRFRGRGNVDGHEQIVDELHAAGGAERPEIEARIGKSGDEALGLGAGLLVAGEIDHGLARRYHSRRAATLAVEKARPLGRKRSHVTLFVGDGVRAELDDNLSLPGGFDQPIRALHHVFERLRGRQARKHDVRLRTDVGRRAAGNAADFLELGERAAAVAHHPIAALDQIFGDRQSDLADTDEADRFHSLTLRSYLTPALELKSSSSDWSEKFTLIPSEPSITVHSRSSKLRS